MLRCILPNIASLYEHVHRLLNQPMDYRPEKCPHCNHTHLWYHGHFTRKPRGDSDIKEVKVPRWRCTDCRRTFSVLPSCVPPRRWYLWSVQQALLVCLLSGATQEQCAEDLAHLGPALCTIQRWWRWLKRKNNDFSHYLRSFKPEWGRTADWREFWRVAMADEPMRELMAYLAAQGLTIP
jgi:transposase-like protein